MTTYQELLLHQEWKAKRKEIIVRDNLKCRNCCNANLIEDSLIGYLIYNGANSNGTLFSFYGINSLDTLIRKPVFIKKQTSIIYYELSKPHIAYIDKDSENEKFARMIAIRDVLTGETEIPLNIYDESFRQNSYNLRGKLSENYRWSIVPSLHVHHSYYQVNLKPWEYPDSSLETLCWVCHEKLHKEQTIPYLNENGKQLNRLMPCPRCFGAGWFPEYKHIQEGICFECNGARYKEFITH